MAGYASSTLNLVHQPIGNAALCPSLWTHQSTDAGAVVQVAGYITDAAKRGMKVGDIVWHTDTDASPPLVTSHAVIAINATTGAADLSSGVSISGTNSD